MSVLNPENYCISRKHNLLGESTKQSLSNFEPKKPLRALSFNLEAPTFRAEAWS